MEDKANKPTTAAEEQVAPEAGTVRISLDCFKIIRQQTHEICERLKCINKAIESGVFEINESESSKACKSDAEICKIAAPGVPLGFARQLHENFWLCAVRLTQRLKWWKKKHLVDEINKMTEDKSDIGSDNHRRLVDRAKKWLKAFAKREGAPILRRGNGPKREYAVKFNWHK